MAAAIPAPVGQGLAARGRRVPFRSLRRCDELGAVEDLGREPRPVQHFPVDQQRQVGAAPTGEPALAGAVRIDHPREVQQLVGGQLLGNEIEDGQPFAASVGARCASVSRTPSAVRNTCASCTGVSEDPMTWSARSLARSRIVLTPMPRPA